MLRFLMYANDRLRGDNIERGDNTVRKPYLGGRAHMVLQSLRCLRDTQLDILNRKLVILVWKSVGSVGREINILCSLQMVIKDEGMIGITLGRTWSDNKRPQIQAAQNSNISCLGRGG